jgi:hypothetical protein
MAGPKSYFWSLQTWFDRLSVIPRYLSYAFSLLYFAVDRFDRLSVIPRYLSY